MDDSDPAFDPSMLDELRMLSRPGEDLLLRIVELFHRDAPRYLAELRAGHAAGSSSQIHRASHTLKGAAGNLGLQDLEARCERVVEATRHPQPDAPCPISESDIAAIEAAMEAAMQYLERRVVDG